MNITDLKPGLLVRDGNAILKISHVYSSLITAQVMAEGRPLKAPARTTVRRYLPDAVEGLKPATKAALDKLDELYRGSK